jgi:hypothetical protein
MKCVFNANRNAQWAGSVEKSTGLPLYSKRFTDLINYDNPSEPELQDKID